MALEEIQAKLGGKWESVGNEKVEDFMVGIGFNEGVAQMASVGTVEQTFEVKDGNIVNIFKHGGFWREDRFQLDETFYFEMNQVKRKAITSYKEGKLDMEVQPIESDAPPYRIVREIINGEMVESMIVGEVVAKRTFKHL